MHHGDVGPDELAKGQAVLDSEPTLGRIISIIDELGPTETNKHNANHHLEYTFTEMSTRSHQLSTALASHAKGGKIDLFDGAGVYKTTVMMEPIRNIAVTGETVCSQVSGNEPEKSSICSTS